ncbi:MAG: thioredoxin [Chloroflexota bacterium]|nr:MAG: thioredoxin [Chloroflexota bacterium]
MAHTTNIIDVDEMSFEQEVIQKSSEKTVVVDFWAAWCGPCRMLGPVLERLAEESDSNFVLAKVDVDANPGLAMRFGVQGIPAVKAFRDGQVAGEFVGAQPEPQVRQFLKDVAPGEADGQAWSAELMIAERRWAEAAELYQLALEKNPADLEARLGLARALIGQGQGCEAGEYLAELRDEALTMARAERLLPVADYVCSVAENGDENAEVTVVEAQYRQSARLLSQGKVAPAMDGLLDVLRYSKVYRDGRVREVMLGIFELLGDEDPLTGAYRREMASVLF